MCSARDSAALPALGFPIRASAGHRLFSASPRLIAAVHALHRLLVPRHPPCALTILTVIVRGHARARPAGGEITDLPAERSAPSAAPLLPALVGCCAVFKVREEARPSSAWRGPKRLRSALEGWSLKTQQHAAVAPGGTDSLSRSGRRLPRPCHWPLFSARRASAHRGRLARRPRLRGLPRKEVIQPQLPLRLPCYDFTPVASPTFDGSLPCGLGHRLRVLLTPMV